MRKTLLVVVTRMRADCGKADDEFVNDWRRPAADDDALLRGEDVDILLIHGNEKRFLEGWDSWPPQRRGEADDITGIVDAWIGQALRRHRIQAPDDYRECYLLYHEPAVEHVVSREAVSIPLTDGPAVYSSIKGGLLKAVGELRLDEARLGEVKERFPRLRITEFSVRKHRITNALAPLSLDLRTAAERSWNESLANEIAKAYEGGAACRALEEARRQVHGPQQPDEPELRVIASIVGEATRGSPAAAGGVQSAWTRVAEVFPRKASTPAHVFETIMKLEDLDRLKTVDAEEIKRVRLWMDRLNDALEELRRELEG